MDEIPAVPLPLHVEVIEDNQTELNIMIVKGAKIEGRVSFLQSDDIAAGKYGKTLENIILEFSNDKEQFRIATGKQGEFSFPLVIPGRWTLKIFPNSVPSGYETERSTYQFDLNAGERIYIEPVLKEKTKNIIFKPGNVKLSN